MAPWSIEMDDRCLYERNSQQAQAVNPFIRASRGCGTPTNMIDTQGKSTELSPSGGRPSQLDISFAKRITCRIL